MSNINDVSDLGIKKVYVADGGQFTPYFRNIISANQPNHPVFSIRLYCESGKCPVRKFEVKMKLYDIPDYKFNVNDFKCPFCRSKKISFHHFIEDSRVLLKDFKSEI